MRLFKELGEGRWAKALAEKPQFVLIQFGHNDSHAKDHPEATDAATDYRDYLRRAIAVSSISMTRGGLAPWSLKRSQVGRTRT